MRKIKVLRYLRLLRLAYLIFTKWYWYFKSLFNKERAFCNSISRLQSFSNDKVRNNLLNELIRSKIVASRLDIVVNTVLKILSKNAPVKKRYVRANRAPFMDKVLKKAIMGRSQLGNVSLKNKITWKSSCA